MKYLIIAPGYPSEENKYNNGFIHTRVKLYLKNKMDVTIFSYTKGALRKYTYEDVTVYTGGKKAYIEFLKEKTYDKYLVHFGFKKIIKPIIKNNSNSTIITWVHGTEALGWYRRLFAFNIKKPYRFLGYIILNIIQLNFLRRLINSNYDITYVFVSNWMKNILEKDTHSIGKIKKYKIIPNVIDDSIFKYQEKKPNDRLNILSIRPFQSKKYANDLTVKTILKLSTEPYFSKLKFTIYGDGRLFDKTLKPIKNIENVKIYRKFLTHNDISREHKKNGIMLIPTRQDAQGVSMCEAMSSGLVPVTSNNTAIPEYVNNECGYLANNVDELASAITEMYYNEKVFLAKSKKAHNFIFEKCSPKKVMTEELNLINKKGK